MRGENVFAQIQAMANGAIEKSTAAQAKMIRNEYGANWTGAESVKVWAVFTTATNYWRTDFLSPRLLLIVRRILLSGEIRPAERWLREKVMNHAHPRKNNPEPHEESATPK